jgi:hypothetical protein
MGTWVVFAPMYTHLSRCETHFVKVAVKDCHDPSGSVVWKLRSWRGRTRDNVIKVSVHSKEISTIGHDSKQTVIYGDLQCRHEIVHSRYEIVH